MRLLRFLSRQRDFLFEEIRLFAAALYLFIRRRSLVLSVGLVILIVLGSGISILGFPQDLRFNLYAELFGIAVIIWGLDFVLFYSEFKRLLPVSRLAIKEVSRDLVLIGVNAYTAFNNVIQGFHIPLGFYNLILEIGDQQVIQKGFDLSTADREDSYARGREYILDRLKLIKPADLMNLATSHPGIVYSFSETLGNYSDRLEKLETRFAQILTPVAVEALHNLQDSLYILHSPIDVARTSGMEKAQSIQAYMSRVQSFPDTFRDQLLQFHEGVVRLLKLAETGDLIEIRP